MWQRQRSYRVEHSAVSLPPPRQSVHAGFKAPLGRQPDTGRAAPKVGGCFSFPSGFRFTFPFLPPPVRGRSGKEERGATATGERKTLPRASFQSHICFQQTSECWIPFRRLAHSRG